jgi:hypothetical protein
MGVENCTCGLADTGFAYAPMDECVQHVNAAGFVHLVAKLRLLQSFAEASGNVLARLEQDLCQFCNRAPYSHTKECPQERMVRCWDDLLEFGAVR